jgi:hypothetical protein
MDLLEATLFRVLMLSKRMTVVKYTNIGAGLGRMVARTLRQGHGIFLERIGSTT